MSGLAILRWKRFWILGTGVTGGLMLCALAPELGRTGGVVGSLGRLVPAAAWLPFVCALVCEYVDSSLGMGYGTMLTPLLMIAGYPARLVVPCVLFSELATGMAAALLHHWDGNVDFVRDPEARNTALLLTVLSAAGAVVGGTIAVKMSAYWLNVAIAVIVLSAGAFVLLAVRRKLRYRRGHMIGLSALAAFNKSLSGGGYGPLVTAGQVVCGIGPKKAVAVTSLAESVTCMVGLFTYLHLRGTLDWGLALVLTTGALLSVPMATLTVRALPDGAVRTAVGLVTILLGIAALFRVVSI
jgi:uncharacterized protein